MSKKVDDAVEYMEEAIEEGAEYPDAFFEATVLFRLSDKQESELKSEWDRRNA